MRPVPSLSGFITVFLFVLRCCASGQKQELGMTFIRHPQPFIAPLGDDVFLECNLNLAPEKFVWRHRPLGSNKWEPFNQAANSSGKASILTVNFDHKSKAGDYRCIAFYGTSGLASDPARLTLATIDKFSDKNDVEIKVPVGNTVPITCPVSYSAPEPDILFFKDNRPVKNTTLTSGKTLIIENARPSDSGKYHCTATNYLSGQTLISNYNTILNAESTQTLQNSYFIKQPQTKYKVLRGKNVTLECFGAGYPVPQVQWSKLGKPLPSRSTSTAMGLTITNVQPSDQGEYDCAWNNGKYPLKLMIILIVVEPPRVLKGPKGLTFAEGGELELSCSVSGQPEPTIEWLINGETLTVNNNVEIRGATLSISSVEKKHAGIVQCVASNEYGSHSGYNLLRVTPKQHVGGALESRHEYGIPNSSHKHTRIGGRRRGKDGKRKGPDVLVPPEQPNVTRLSDTSVMVRWSVPENNGLEIQFFKVQYRELGQRMNGKQAKWMTANTEIPNHVRSFEVCDLQPNHTYRFRIAAVYSNLDNKLSPNSVRFHLNRSTSINSDKMPIPLFTNTESLSPHRILLLWQNPDRTANIDGFYVYHRASTSAGEYIKTTVEGKNSTRIVISHLQSDTTYEFKVQSFSTDAASEFSKILREKTKKLPVPDVPVQQVKVENEQKPVETPRNSNMYAIVGGVLGGAILLGGLAAITVAYKKRKFKQSRDSSQDQAKPITNGRVLNGGITDSKINITSNPLAGLDPVDDAHQPKSGHQSSMEMASFLNGQNNNSNLHHNVETTTGSTVNSMLKESALHHGPPVPLDQHL